MSQAKGLHQRMFNQLCKFDEMIHNRADLFHWSEARLTLRQA